MRLPGVIAWRKWSEGVSGALDGHSEALREIKAAVFPEPRIVNYGSAVPPDGARVNLRELFAF